MARGVILSLVRTKIYAEVGYSPATNPARDLMVNQLIDNKQQWLATEYDWPFLDCRFDLAAPANTQYLTFPTHTDLGETVALNLERFPKVECFWNNTYHDVAYGIGGEQYNSMNITLGQQSDPIQRWRMASNPDDPSPNQLEVWPVPVTASTLRFTGQRALLPVVVSGTSADDTNPLDLDSMLIVYAVAADLLTRAKQADAANKSTLFTRRLAWVRQNYPTKDERQCLGSENDFNLDRRVVGMTIVTH